jgi:hypothetical protein
LKKTTSPSANKAFGANLNRDNNGPFWFADKATTFAAVAQNSQSIWSQYGASPSDDKSAPGEAQFNNNSSAVNQSDQPPLLLQKE